MVGERRSRATEAFFGRRHGKTLRPLPAGAMARAMPRLSLDLTAPAPAQLASLFDAPVSGVRLEIGFGSGEHLLAESGRLPDAGFIGVEPFVNGMAHFLLSLEAAPRGNVRVYGDDATRLLDWLPPGSIAGIDLFYPDPWPKKRHWKRRFVGPSNLDRFARVMKSGARFRFASDIDGYVDWTLLRCLAHPDFAWEARSAEDWRAPYPHWPGTRYEAKAIAAGRKPSYLTFTRA